MNIFGKIGAAETINRCVNQIVKLNDRGAPIMQYIPILVTLLCTIVSALAVPEFVKNHVLLYAILNALAQVLHSALPSTVSTSTPSVPPKAGVIVLVALLILAAPHGAMAQTAAPAPAPTPIQNLYMAGVSGNSSGSPMVAGTALYARLLTGGTYAFTIIDALPASFRPFVVNTNIAAGVAQKLVTIDGVSIYVPTSAGISFNGTNTGWAWSTGAMIPLRVKKGKNWFLAPTARVVKSSVSGGTGYQPIVGLLFGWGQ